MIRDTSSQDRVMQSAPTRSPRWTWIAILVLIVLAVLSVRSWLSSAGAVNSERLRLGTVSRGDLVRDVLANGQVVAANSPTLYAGYSGTVALKVQAGQKVGRGAVLAEIDSPSLNNEFEREQSSLEQLEVEYNRGKILAEKQKLLARRTADERVLALQAAKREAERSQRAYQRGALSEVDYLRYQDAVQSAEILAAHAETDAKLEARSADFELKTKQQNLERQRLMVADLARRVDELKVRAPADAVVGSLAIVDRTVVAAGAPLLTLVDLSELAVDVSVPESYADDLAPGLMAEMQINGQTYRGEVAAISPEVINNQVLARLRFVDAMPAGLRQNQRVTSRLLFETRQNVLLLPRGPSLDAAGGRFAYRLDGELAERVRIELGATSVNSVEVVSGLQIGDRVVISGADLFADAERVTVTE
ncbi:HlyD family efflux transporter periplasmic adaptor subunit [Pseudoxanthomonas sp. CAU 1598]|uniref:HlyD family efflux transporter periplasmic adaptor subunit n=2 Tax=Pseudomarimonas arenosa TaxID=2774145 RepID=A0AAW3ZLK9_9GAMM|nr:HlyD family efflux transporter periplasmic adaptor subunit [Pseudomarimonas arenosa]